MTAIAFYGLGAAAWDILPMAAAYSLALQTEAEVWRSRLGHTPERTI
jgi:hypothetical protein